MSNQTTYSEDYKNRLGVAINSMLSDDSVGNVYVINRVVANLSMEPVNYDDIVNLIDTHSSYEIIIFDGGNIHGDLWKTVFYPKSGVFHFVDESEVVAN